MVSVIIPSYNHSRYLKQRIDSVLNQTYTDYELIILDDYSPDNSRDIIENYRNNPKISQIVYNEKNSGSTFKQWEKGISLAKGDYIWIAESDDFSDNTFLEKCIELIKEKKLSLCFSQSVMVDEYNTIIGVKDKVLNKSTVDSNTFNSEFLLYGNSIYNASMVIFRKDIVEGFPWEQLASFKYCGDWFFWSNVLFKKNILISEVNEPLNKFRIHSNNVSNMSEKKGLTFLEGFQISKFIYITLLKNSLSINVFCKKWFEKWHDYHNIYSFTRKVDVKILIMFALKEPRVLYWSVKRFIKKRFY